MIAIARFTEHRWGKTQRDRYLKALEHRFDWLAQNPGSPSSAYRISTGIAIATPDFMPSNNLIQQALRAQRDGDLSREVALLQHLLDERPGDPEATLHLALLHAGA